MREGWKIEMLGNMSNISYGYTAKASPEDVGPKFLRITDIQNGYVNWEKVPTCPINSRDLDKHRLQTGDLVFARTGATTGKSYLISDPPEAVAASYLIRMRIRKDGVDPAFLALFFQTKEYWRTVAEGTSGSAQGGFNASKLAELQLPLPPIPEQKRIVAILDEAFAGIDTAIANTEKNLANARELFDSYLNSVFSSNKSEWQEISIEEICYSIIDCINKTAPQVNGPTPFKMIRTTNVRNGKINLESVKYVDEEIYNKWTRRQTPLRGDIILTREAPMGEVGILDSDEKVFLGQRLVSYRVNPALLDNRFMLYEFQSKYMQSQIHSLASGSTVQHMRVPDSKKLKVLLPSLQVQEELVERLDSLLVEIRRVEKIYQQKLTALAELKQSLLHKAFSGELTMGNVVPITSAKKSSAPPTTDSPAFAAHVMAVAYHWHEARGKNKTFGHVKAQKTLHLVEALAQIDLGRVPVKDAAGPNDFVHMRTAEKWARENDYYDFVQRTEGRRGYDFVKGKRYSEWLAQALDTVEPYKSALERVVNLLMPLDTQKAELVATVYAAWNNLLLDGHKPTEAEIVYEARDNWHPAKQQYTPRQFREAIDRLRSNGMVPTGTGKRVTGQESFEL
ncbi:restriction endonuclease subunit S [Saccharospirillum sp.]|uniref:restriction endonuclease subunit S n=1 Tax=Saccharospirillum sp. TaxID=2033801 RepID=UPI00349FD6E7